MKGTLTKIMPLHAEKIIPEGAKQEGATPDGRPLFRVTRMRSRAVPWIDPETGLQRQRKNQATGEPMYGLNKPEVYEESFLCTLESDGQGNIYMEKYTPPSAEQLAAEARAAKIASMSDQLAESLVDAGLTPEDLIAAISARREQRREDRRARKRAKKAKRGEAVAGAGDEADAEIGDTPDATDLDAADPDAEPRQVGPGYWEFPNGQRFGGPGDRALSKADAIAAYRAGLEAQAEAHAFAAATPEV